MTADPRPRRAASSLALAIALAAAALAACDAVDGTGAYALWELCEHPEGAFHFHYLEPPWEPAAGFSEAAPLLYLDPDDDPAADAAGPGARVRLEAWASDRETVAAEAAARRARWEAAGFAVEAPRTFANAAGDVGVVQRAARGDERVAEILFDGGRVVALSLWGRGAVDGADYRLLLASFAPRAAGDP